MRRQIAFAIAIVSLATLLVVPAKGHRQDKDKLLSTANIPL